MKSLENYMNVTSQIPLGASASKSVVVTHDLTVAHYHPDMPEVYGTPFMIYLMEVAAADAIEPFLPNGWVSVGASINVRHLAATPTGFTVTAFAKVIAIEERLITFHISAHDGIETIGQGEHVRTAIELRRFENKVQEKAAIER